MEFYEVFILATIALIGYGIFSYDKYIKDKYIEDNFSIDSISILNITEKLRYGIPILPYNIFYRYSIPFVFMGSTFSLYRKIELTDIENNELTKYVEIELNGNTITKFVEIDGNDI